MHAPCPGCPLSSYHPPLSSVLHPGGTRFIGQYLARQLVEEGHQVTLLTRGKAPIAARIPDDTDESHAAYSDAVQHVAADRKDADAVKNALKGREFNGAPRCEGRRETWGVYVTLLPPRAGYHDADVPEPSFASSTSLQNPCHHVLVTAISAPRPSPMQSCTTSTGVRRRRQISSWRPCPPWSSTSTAPLRASTRPPTSCHTLRRTPGTPSPGTRSEGEERGVDKVEAPREYPLALAPQTHPWACLHGRFTKVSQPHAQGKLNTEELLEKRGVNWTSIRPVYIYGPLNYNPVEEWFFHRIAAGRPILVPGKGNQVTQLGHVKDLAAAFRKVLGNPKAARQAYNISGER